VLLLLKVVQMDIIYLQILVLLAQLVQLHVLQQLLLLDVALDISNQGLQLLVLLVEPELMFVFQLLKLHHVSLDII